MIDRYVQVDPETMLVTGGPFLWDGVAVCYFGPYTTMLEADALEAGYEYPPPPPPPDDPPPDDPPSDNPPPDEDNG